MSGSEPFQRRKNSWYFSLALFVSPCQHIGASELKACQRRQGAIHRNAGVIQIPLKLFCRLLALMQRK